MNMEKTTECNYYTHDFKKKGEKITINDSSIGKYIQEMECSKCKITTYYPSEAFNNNGELK